MGIFLGIDVSRHLVIREGFDDTTNIELPGVDAVEEVPLINLVDTFNQAREFVRRCPVLSL